MYSYMPYHFVLTQRSMFVPIQCFPVWYIVLSTILFHKNTILKLMLFLSMIALMNRSSRIDPL
jgi:hypothetical protein